MAFRINDFISHAGKYGEFARADKFDVRIPVPKALIRNQAFTSRELTLQCEAAELPGRNVNMIEYRHHSFTERVPHFNTFGETSLTFYCNNEFAEKKFFDAWIDSMVPIYSGLVKYYQDDSYDNLYTSNIVLRQYKLTSEEPIYRCTLVEAIPTAISPLSLNWSDDSIHRLQVSFAFKLWRTEGVTTVSPELSQSFEIELTDRQRQRI